MCNIAQSFRCLHTILRMSRTQIRSSYYGYDSASLDAIVRRPRGAYGFFSTSERCSIMTRAQVLRLRFTTIYIYRSTIYLCNHLFIICLLSIDSI
jgi:hypothetical protein